LKLFFFFEYRSIDPKDNLIINTCCNKGKRSFAYKLNFMDLENGWHVLSVRSRWKKKVHESLKDISVEQFLPEIRTIRKWSGRNKTVLKPWFPSYVFFNVKAFLEFHRALSVHGTCTYIRFGK
jgi:hypothetical protein